MKDCKDAPVPVVVRIRASLIERIDSWGQDRCNTRSEKIAKPSPDQEADRAVRTNLPKTNE